jgi:hypothetical protein
MLCTRIYYAIVVVLMLLSSVSLASQEMADIQTRGCKSSASSKEKPLLERQVGLVKGYEVIIYVLAGVLALMTIAWFWILTYRHERHSRRM